jgi:hypothetical protein
MAIMPIRHVLSSALRSLLAFALACAALVVVNWAGGELGGLLRLPQGARHLAWDLTWVWIAGIAAAWLVAKLAPRAPRLHAAAWGALMLGVAIAAVREIGDWPIWFSAGVVLGAPLQAWLGARLALRGRRRSDGMQP